jgi:diguanylate cyclase (GGDEF)-like protein
MTWGGASGESFEPDACWALRSGYTHDFVPERGDPPCNHLLASEDDNTLCVPLASNDETMGVLIVRGSEDDPVDAGIRALCSTLGETLALSIGNIRLREALRSQSIRDPLTGLYNRRFLDEVLGRETSRSRRSDQPLSVLALDVDHFKRFNDQWGHDAGDAVLTALAQTLREQAREMDLTCRLGGEEFLVLLPRCDRPNAIEVGERIRRAVEELVVTHQSRTLEGISASVGVATYPEDAADGESLIKAADRALYAAKAEGRNQVKSAA